MKSFKEKPCAICGKMFTPSGPKAKYCSDECRSKVPHKKGAAEALNKKTAVATMILAQSESIETFKTDAFDGVRTVKVDGEKWYVATDVCKALGIADASYAVKGLLKSEIRSEGIRSENRFNPNVLFVSKPGVFHLMSNCRDTPVTQPVKERINHEILPEVDRTGMYVGESMALEEMFALQAQINLDHKKRLDACDEHLAMHDMRLADNDKRWEGLRGWAVKKNLQVTAIDARLNSVETKMDILEEDEDWSTTGMFMNSDYVKSVLKQLKEEKVAIPKDINKAVGLRLHNYYLANKLPHRQKPITEAAKKHNREDNLWLKADLKRQFDEYVAMLRADKSRIMSGCTQIALPC